ncbi:KDM8 [Branchiostoma lanceolatum]|uniref:KDM8 protein n=1 Tax=Branchiostoma lanceolatum TaxID=7740 RepID=A0A8J9ZHN3_BRALA|nr:KDM8 [Branchiostoma lanceolatum]
MAKVFLVFLLCALTRISSQDDTNAACHGTDGSIYSPDCNTHPAELTKEQMFKNGHMKRFGAHRPPDHIVEELPYMIAPEDFHTLYVSRHKPVVIKGAAKYWPAYTKWTDEYLTEKFGDVTFNMETKDDDKVNLPPSRKLKDFLKVYQEKDLYLVDEVHPGMREDVILPLCLRCEEMSSKFFVSYYWHSSGNTSSSLHIDTDENMLCVIRGSKKAILVSPVYSNDLYADDANLLGVSPVPADKVDLEKFPRVMNVRYHLANMEEGDMLYLPQMWWHQIDSGGGRQQAVALWWKSKPWWKDHGKHAPPVEADAVFEGSKSERKYSFGNALALYETWVNDVAPLAPRLKCESQQARMSEFRFETDKGDNWGDNPDEDWDGQNHGSEEDESEHIDPLCDFDRTNPLNPCPMCMDDDADQRCIRYILDYCQVYQDRGCVVQLPQLLNKISKEEFENIAAMESPFHS